MRVCVCENMSTCVRVRACTRMRACTHTHVLSRAQPTRTQIKRTCRHTYMYHSFMLVCATARASCTNTRMCPVNNKSLLGAGRSPRSQPQASTSAPCIGLSPPVNCSHPSRPSCLLSSFSQCVHVREGREDFKMGTLSYSKLEIG